MFHKINLPDCAPQLMRLTEIAGRTVAFGLSHDLSILDHYDWDGSEQKGLAKSLGAEFVEAHGGHRLLAAVKQSFLAYFVDWGRPEVGKWLWGKYAIVAAPVVKLVALSPAQKEGVLDAFRHDVDLDGILRNPDPKVFRSRSLPDISASAREIIKELLINFYEDILVDKGVTADVLGEEKALDHQEILRSYRQANLRLKVCPGCDGEPPLGLASRIQVQPDGKLKETLWLSANVDHFLPKSKYAFLAVHPLNLVPLCTICNQVRKRDNDPLEAQGVIDLDDIYHPYIRGAYGELMVVVERDEANDQPCVKFYAPANVPHAEARLHSLDHVLGLQTYWNGDLRDERLEIEVESALRNALQDEREADERYPDDWLRIKLARISHYMTYYIGRKPRMVASSAYATWLATDDQAYRERGNLLNRALGIEPGVVNPAQKRIQPRAIN